MALVEAREESEAGVLVMKPAKQKSALPNLIHPRRKDLNLLESKSLLFPCKYCYTIINQTQLFIFVTKRLWDQLDKLSNLKTITFHDLHLDAISRMFGEGFDVPAMC